MSETERSDGLPVRAELRHEAKVGVRDARRRWGDRLRERNRDATKIEDESGRKGPRAEGKKREREGKKGVDTGRTTADSQLLTWVNGLPGNTMQRCFVGWRSATATLLAPPPLRVFVRKPSTAASRRRQSLV